MHLMVGRALESLLLLGLSLARRDVESWAVSA
jgi:hypothetical protein